MRARRVVVATGMGAVVVAISLFSVLHEDKKGERATTEWSPMRARPPGHPAL